MNLKKLLIGIIPALCLFPLPGMAQLDAEVMAGRIAKSLQSLKGPQYKTAAFYRIRNAGAMVDINELIDFSNVKIVQGRRLRVIDRSKLSLVLKEQKVQLSDFVSAKKYQELGKVMGVDLFIYGTFYRDALVLKAIDTQNSAIAWADVFPISSNAQEAALLLRIGGEVVNSIRKDLSRLKESNIRQVSFWNFSPVEPFTSEALMDYISVALTKEGSLTVVDRENLKLITNEQKLNQSMFIDQENAKRLGELYGVDAFIYGSVTRRPDGTIIASLKMLNIFNGVIEWADLIKVDQKTGGGDLTAAVSGAAGGGPKAPAGMAYIPAGEFVMGTNGSPREANPRHNASTGSYFLDTTEVTNAQYAKFVKARKYRSPVGWQGSRPPGGSENRPVVGITWEDARRYCRYVRKRMPTEVEWEKAARGNTGQKYPWSGDTFSPGFSVTRESGKKAPVSVRSQTKDISPYGLKFMAGNVREWVATDFKAYPGGTASRKQAGMRAVRGGSWATNFHSADTYFRGASNPNHAWPDVGIRCAKSIKK